MKKLWMSSIMAASLIITVAPQVSGAEELSKTPTETITLWDSILSKASELKNDLLIPFATNIKEDCKNLVFANNDATNNKAPENNLNNCLLNKNDFEETFNKLINSTKLTTQVADLKACLENTKPVEQMPTTNKNSCNDTIAKQNPVSVPNTSKTEQVIQKPVTKPSTNKPVQSDKNTSSNSSVSAFEQKVVELTNAERAKMGLKALTLNSKLSNVAHIKAQDMHDKKYFDHTSPTYGSPFEMMKQFGISYSYAAENIAMGQTSPEAVVKAWMNSAGHRANILSKEATSIGVGYVADGHYWSQMFIR